MLHEWITSLKPRMLLARKSRGIVGHVSADNLDDYNEKLKAAQDKYAVNAAPSMYLAKESIDTITDMATRLSIHEDVLRAYMGIKDDDKEQYYICALQSDSARASALAEHSCLGDADVDNESNLGAALAFASALDNHE